jgi:hypothetical protein
MISRALEWHRTVDAKPTPDTIDRRIAAIGDLVKAYDEAKQWDVILGSIAGVVAGFEGNRPNNSNAVDLIFKTLQAKDSTVPQDLTDNALELRAAAATALGELVTRNPDAHPDQEAILIAATLHSGLNLRPRVKERYLKSMLDELLQASKKTLLRAQQMKRHRIVPGKELLAIDDNAAVDPLAAIKALTKAAKKMANDFSIQASLDREELDVLWWLFSQASTTFGASIEYLPPGKAAIVVGVEIANMCLLPPAQNAVAFVKRGSQLTQKSDTKRSLEKAMEETDSATWSLLNDNEGASLGKSYPVLCPLSWLCSKLSTTNLATGWAPEFHATTGLEASLAADVFTLAEQAYLERIAERIYSAQNGG